MRKTLLPLLVSLLLCGVAATATAIVATKARAQSLHKPTMVALVTPGPQMAANTSADADPMHGRMRGRNMPMAPAEMAARRREICRDLYAREVGRLAYAEAKLDITAAQQPLFDHWKTVRLDIARKREDDCGSLPTPQADAGRASPVDRMARREDRLKKRLADLDSERPVLAALYAALSPQQKMELSLENRPPMMGRMFAQGMGRGPRFTANHPPLPGPGAPPPAP